MKTIMTGFFVLCGSLLHAQELITAAEYFIDQAVAPGSGVEIPISSANEVSASVEVPTSTLENGLHTLGLRVRNGSGAWSLYGRKHFWIHQWNASSSAVAAEYFFNQDPGEGSGTPFPVSAGSSTMGTATIGLMDLSPGLQTLCMRFRDDEGKWAIYARKHFFVMASTSPNQLWAAEYFFDNDPGYGNAMALDIPASEEVSASFIIPLPETIGQGIHVLVMRTLDANGKWSVPMRKLFFVHGADPELQIIAAEYFINEDPGEANATPLPITPTTALGEVFEFSLSDQLPLGEHMLYIRVLRGDGVWSIYAARPFTVDLSAGMDGQERSFEIFPNPTADVLNFKFSEGEVASVAVFDLQGKMVLQEDFPDGYIHLGKLGKGVYLVQIHLMDGYAISKKIVVQ